MKSFKKDKLQVEIYENRTLMGEAAARDIKAKIAELLSQKAEINMIFAAAPSQNDVLKSLVEDKEIEWNRVTPIIWTNISGWIRMRRKVLGTF